MLLDEVDHARIQAATKAAETTTTGEIVCVVAEEASHYMEVPLAWGATCALVAPIAGLAFGFAVDWLGEGFGNWNVGHVAASRSAVISALVGYALAQGALFIVVALVVAIPIVRRAMTPRFLRRGHVHQRAMEQFFARGLHTVGGGASVLIYASLKDRMAEVVADAGIDQKVGVQAWDDAIRILTTGIKARRPGDGFVGAIEACGRLLALHFPADRTDSNDLPDDLVETGHA